MLSVYPDNFLVPVIFVENFMRKKTSGKLNEDLNGEELFNKVKELKNAIKQDEQQKFRNDDKKECYDKLQEELVMEWKYEGEYSLEVNNEKILADIDEEYACSETGKI